MKVFAGALVVCAVLLPVDIGSGTARPFTGTFSSPEALASAVLDGFARGDAATLRALALTEQEFRTQVWPELPVSRPERNMPFDYVWKDLDAKSRGHLAASLQRTLPPSPRLIRVTFDGGTTEYGGFAVLRNSRLLIAGADGQEMSVRLFGSIMRRDGRYKLFSYVTD